MVSILVKDGEPFEKALRRFKKKWEKAGILRDVKAKSYYLKPSELKKEGTESINVKSDADVSKFNLVMECHKETGFN